MRIKVDYWLPQGAMCCWINYSLAEEACSSLGFVLPSALMCYGPASMKLNCWLAHVDARPSLFWSEGNHEPLSRALNDRPPRIDSHQVHQLLTRKHPGDRNWIWNNHKSNKKSNGERKKESYLQQSRATMLSTTCKNQYKSYGEE